MRRFHLIPIVRLATKANGDTWDAPSEAEIDNWVNFGFYGNATSWDTNTARAFDGGWSDLAVGFGLGCGLTSDMHLRCWGWGGMRSV